MKQKICRSLDQRVLLAFPFAHSLHAGIQSYQTGRTKEPCWKTRCLQTERSFSMMQDFRQSSEAVGLSQVSKMLRQLTGQISAHYSSSKIINTHLCFFRPDHGPHTVLYICFVQKYQAKWGHTISTPFAFPEIDKVPSAPITMGI